MTIKVNNKNYPFNPYALKCWSFENGHLIIEFSDKTPPLKIPYQSGDEAALHEALTIKMNLHFIKA